MISFLVYGWLVLSRKKNPRISNAMTNSMWDSSRECNCQEISFPSVHNTKIDSAGYRIFRNMTSVILSCFLEKPKRISGKIYLKMTSIWSFGSPGFLKPRKKKSRGKNCNHFETPSSSHWVEKIRSLVITRNSNHILISWTSPHRPGKWWCYKSSITISRRSSISSIFPVA